MLRPPDIDDPERILAIGGPGSGKSTGWLNIAEWSERTGSPGKFYVIDSDKATSRMLKGYPQLTNRVEYEQVHQWEEYDAALKKYTNKITPDDWLVVDFVGKAWDAVQAYYIEQVFGQEGDQFFMEARMKMKSGAALDGWKDWCVPLSTLALTRRGWLRGDELVEGDEVLTLTPEGSRWEPVQNVYIGEARSRRMLHLDGKSHHSLTTPDHRWLVQEQYRQKGQYLYRWQWRTSETLKSSDRIPHSAPRLDLPSEPKYRDSLVELVAWYWMEGWRTEREGRQSLQGGIGQSIKRNPVYVNRIRAALHDLGFGVHERQRDDGVIVWRLNGWEMEQLETVAPDKLPSWEFLHSLTAAQLKLFIDTCVNGDGTRGAATVWTQVNAESTNRFEWVCLQAGYPIRTTIEPLRGWGNGDRFKVTFLTSGGVWPVMASRLDGSASLEWVDYDEPVWCPTTPSGTWLAKQDGKVFFTGNSQINRLYFAWMNRLVFDKEAIGHRYMTAVADPVRDTDDKEIKEIFGRYGVRPRGQKHLAHAAHTVLLFQTQGDRYFLNSAKDRERELVVGEEITEFTASYLVKQARWTL